MGKIQVNDRHMYDKALLQNEKLRVRIDVIQYNDGVEFQVKSLEYMRLLWYGGCYGRGTKSRSRPDQAFDNEDDEEFLLLTDHEVLYLHMKFPYLLKWDDKQFNISVSLQNFAVFQHFRDQGYVVRHAMSFGADFVLYRDGPVFSHAFASILVQSVDKPSVDLMDITSLIRLTGNVRKRLYITYVDCPNETVVSLQNLEDIRIKLQNSSVESVELSRWRAKINR